MKNRKILSYEKKVFSQNLEDGIIELLVSNLKGPNRISIEIGSGNGSQNMLRNLIENLGYKGIGHDLNAPRWFHENYTHITGIISLSTLDSLVKTWPTLIPDFFSLDIDSFDFWILKKLLKNLNFRPSIICVEYLCYYGPTKLVSAKPNLENYPLCNCGASLGLYKKFLHDQGYRFFTCDTFGINAFFYLEEKITDISKYETNEWAFYRKYKKFVNGIENNDNLEFDYQTLLG